MVEGADWDFSWLDGGRWFEADPSWDYGRIVQDTLAHLTHCWIWERKVANFCRILKRGWVFLTQQVGPLECIEINEFLGARVEPDAYACELASELDEIEHAGFEIVRSEEELLDSIFYDIGAPGLADGSD